MEIESEKETNIYENRRERERLCVRQKKIELPLSTCYCMLLWHMNNIVPRAYRAAVALDSAI